VSIPPRDSNAPLHDSGSAQESPKRDAPPEKLLGSKRIHTLHVNMPNLTSASGSWVLNFAELDEMDAAASVRAAASDLAGPVPLRKVDPKYPPELRTAHVEGEVILYAIIRKDGTVDSIQLVHGVDSHLDANAMEALAQWKFQPAEKYGEPIDLEAVVHIPFRSRAPAF
jgi:TonB family protein